MTISSLISELQKLQALHGDLPVTVPESQGEDHSVIISPDLMDEFYWIFSQRHKGPHIHLS